MRKLLALALSQCFFFFLFGWDSRDKKGGFTSLLGFSILLFLWEDFSFPPIWKEKFARWSENIVWKILVNAFFFISRIYAVHVFLSLAYSLINTPVFVLHCCSVFIFYITYKLDGDVLNGKMGDYVEILFTFVRWSVYSGIYRTVSLTGFYSEKKCIKASRDRDFAEDCGLKFLSWSLFEAFC